MTSRLVISAPASGAGKTTLALGIVAALRARGLSVGAAKVGPDYLDTGWHALASGRPARNLDVWTMGEHGVLASFARGAAETDVTVVEGVMGLFDGHRSGEVPTSTADVAALLQAPVVLVLDASRSAATLAAVAAGLAGFDERVRVAGVVLDRFREGRERAGVERAFERAGLPVLGWVPHDERLSLESRHLGLVGARHDSEAVAAVQRIGEAVERWVDVDALLSIARSAPQLDVSPARLTHAADGPIIAVAQGEAFTFYYQESLETLESLGATLAPFSPLEDSRLPEGTAGIYLGGGYPELHARRLSENGAMLSAMRAAIGDGVPVHAECGGMLYLLESLAAEDGVWPMVGAVPAKAELTGRLQRVGYVEATTATASVLGEAGARVRAHEFRYSACDPIAGTTPAWSTSGGPKGFVVGSVFASYLHLNLIGCPELAASFVASCRDHMVAGVPAEGGSR